LLYSFPENFSPKFSNKSKSSGGDVGIGATNTSHDFVEHDVTALAFMNNLPKPDSFEALQLGSDRYVILNTSVSFFDRKKTLDD
jgi:hypothetical protein